MDPQTAGRNALAQVIYGHMDRLGLTLRDVSDATAIPLTSLHRRLRSDPNLFRVNEIVALAALFQLTPAVLIAQAEVAA